MAGGEHKEHALWLRVAITYGCEAVETAEGPGQNPSPELPNGRSSQAHLSDLARSLHVADDVRHDEINPAACEQASAVATATAACTADGCRSVLHICLLLQLCDLVDSTERCSHPLQ